MRAINATIMRHMNRTLILNQIRLRPISRAELAEETGLTRASVTQIVEELISEGLVIETSIIGRTRLGRRSTQLAINPRSGAFIGINLESDQCTVGVIDMHGKVLRQNTELVVGRTPAEVLDAIAATIRTQIHQVGLERVRGVGMCAPGPVDSANGCLIQPVGLPGWSGLPVSEMLSERTGIPVYLESVVNAQALEEKFFGALGDTFLLVRAAESLSIAAVVDGCLYHGRHDFPAELGSCPSDMSGGASLNEQFSIPALLETAACRTPEELIARCDAGEIPESVVGRLALCVINAIHAFGVDAVVLTGPLGQSDKLRAHLNAAIRGVCRFPITSGPIHPGVASNPIRFAASPAYASLFQTEAGGACTQSLPR